MDLGMILLSFARPTSDRNLSGFSLTTAVCYLSGVLLILASLTLPPSRLGEHPDMFVAATTGTAVGVFLLMVALIQLLNSHDA